MSTKNTTIAFLSGAAIGAVIALLFAPEKGEVTRRRIRRAVEEGRDRVIDGLEEGCDYLSDAYHHGRERLADAIAEGRERLAEAIAEGHDAIAERRETMRETGREYAHEGLQKVERAVRKLDKKITKQ